MDPIIYLEDILQGSEPAVSTQITTVGKLLTPTPMKSVDDQGEFVLDGWQKFWDEPPPQVHGIMAPNVKWLKRDGEFGIYKPAKPYRNNKGEIAYRKVFKDKMEFNPPPIPTTLKCSLPNMLSFFTTPVFFWRPVGVMEVKIKCPNANCPAPAGSFLAKSGFGNFARQVCGIKYFYTLLTERLQCIHCKRSRQGTTAVEADDDDDEQQQQQQQYRWHATSPAILMNLAPAVRNIFPAVICGKRTIDKSVVTLLQDRMNAVSMTKVQRILQQGHDEWYTERRDMYQTLLYQAHTSRGNSSQQGILSLIKPAGSYTPPPPQAPLPCARVLRRAHMILEMERMPVYRASILSLTGEILCLDGTRQVCIIYTYKLINEENQA